MIPSLYHRKSVLVIAVLAGIACPVWGASSVNYTLELGGENYASDIQAGNYQYFVPGSDADDETYVLGNDLTWDVTLAASGTQDNGAGAGEEIQGVANFVFDLELHEDTAEGPIVNQEVFFSSIHNGGESCLPNAGDLPDGLCPPCLAGAGFAFSFDVWTRGPGRVIDKPAPPDRTCTGYPDIPQGGPNMSTWLFPTVEPGKLIGMGAGYDHWDRDGGGGSWTGHGVGKGYGILPVCEGQIDTTALPAGTYVLKLIPRPGNNVLRGPESYIMEDQDAFATEAEQVTGDTITFVLGNPQPPALVSAQSSRIIIPFGPQLDIELMLAVAQATSEPRADGPQWLELGFSQTLYAADGSLDIGDEVVLSPSVSATVSWLDNNTKIKINLGTTVADQTCLAVALSGLENEHGQSLDGDNDLHVRVLAGDSDSSGVVNIRDLSTVKAQMGKTVSNDNANCDVNNDESIDTYDLNAVEASIFNMVGCP